MYDDVILEFCFQVSIFRPGLSAGPSFFLPCSLLWNQTWWLLCSYQGIRITQIWKWLALAYMYMHCCSSVKTVTSVVTHSH